jgi:hypothetical protein
MAKGILEMLEVSGIYCNMGFGEGKAKKEFLV